MRILVDAVLATTNDRQPRNWGGLFLGEQQRGRGNHPVGVELTMLSLQGGAQLAKVGAVILVIEEAGSAIVAYLCGVQQ